MAKPWAKAFYKSKAWQQARELALIRDGHVCVWCGDLATEVDHIIELTAQNVNDPAISLNLNNLRSLCGDCHKQRHADDRATARMKDRDLAAVATELSGHYEFDSNGFLKRASPP